MNTTHSFQSSNRLWSLVLFLAVLVGLAQFGLGQFSPWVIAAPFVALLVMDIESAWSRGHGARGGERRGDKETGRPGEGVLPQVAAAFVFYGVVIGAVMTAVGDSAQHSGGRFVMAKSAGGGGCGSGGMCGGGQATVAKASSAGGPARNATQSVAGGCGSGGCGSAAGGCGSGGCGGGGTVANSAAGAKSACGCGSGAKRTAATGTQSPVSAAGRNVDAAAPMPNPNQMRPGLPPIMARPNGTVPGVTNQPIPISPQAMSVVSAQPKMTIPRPPPTLIAKPAAAPTNAPTAIPAPSHPQPSTIAPSTPPPSTSTPPDLKTAIEQAAALPKETKETKNQPKPGGSE